MKHYAKIVLFSIFLTFTVNNTLQAGWFSSFKGSISPLINLNNAKKQVKETLKNKWHYAAAGLVLFPALVYYFKDKWANKKNLEKKPSTSSSTSTDSSNGTISRSGSPLLNALTSTDRIVRNLSASSSSLSESTDSIASTNTSSSSATPTLSPTIERSPISLLGSQDIEPSASPVASPELQDDRSLDQQEQKLEDSYIEITTLKQPSSALECSQNLEDSGFLSDSWVQIPAQPQKGNSIYRQIMRGTYSRPQNKCEQLENIVHIIHHFYDCAKKKDQGFTEGTLVIEDPEEKIYNTFLAYVQHCYPHAMNQEVMFSMHEAYPRRSSHFNEFYFHIFPENKPTHFGIDTTEEAHLPIEQMHHILFGKKDDRYMFIRMETHGLQGRDVIGHIFGYVESLGRKLCPLIFGSDVGEQLRKERVPAEELNRFTQVVGQIDPQNVDECKNQAKGLGIQFMYQKIKEYLANHRSSNNNTSDLPAWYPSAQNFVQQLQQNYDYLHNRIGNEVILKIGRELQI